MLLLAHEPVAVEHLLLPDLDEELLNLRLGPRVRRLRLRAVRVKLRVIGIGRFWSTRRSMRRRSLFKSHRKTITVLALINSGNTQKNTS